MRRRIYEVLTNPRRDDRVGRLVSFALLLLIALNVTSSVLKTDVEIARRAPQLFQTFETVSVVIFTIEYLLRLWSCTVDPRFAGIVRGRFKHALRPMSLIDLAAIAPFYVELLLPGTLDLRFLRVLRLLRIFRVLNVGPLAVAFGRLARVAQRKRVELGVSMAVVGAATVLAAGAMYMAEHQIPDTQFTSIPRAMWWSIVTITTIGYGDMTPTSPAGQVIAGFVALVGICAVALPVAIISSGYLDEMNASKSEVLPPRCPNCGHDPSTARHEQLED